MIRKNYFNEIKNVDKCTKIAITPPSTITSTILGGTIISKM